MLYASGRFVKILKLSVADNVLTKVVCSLSKSALTLVELSTHPSLGTTIYVVTLNSAGDVGVTAYCYPPFITCLPVSTLSRDHL